MCFGISLNFQVDATGIEEKDIELVMSQVNTFIKFQHCDS